MADEVFSVVRPARKLRKVKVGKVISNKMDKTVVVAVNYFVKHKLYDKTLRRTTKLKAHDANNECLIGDYVEIMETRPISKQKRWRLVSVIKKAK
jgi:small subunit ribosomal protein S17